MREVWVWRLSGGGESYVFWIASERKVSMSARKQTLEILAKSISNIEVSHPMRVAVDGRTASGKTSLADELSETLQALGRTVIRTSIDGFHAPRAIRYRQGQGSARGYYEDARDIDAIKNLLLNPLGPTGNGFYKTVSFDLERDSDIALDFLPSDPSDIFIVDGTFLQRATLVASWDYVVFVNVPKNVAIERGVIRDAERLGGFDRARKAHVERYQEAFEIYLSECDPSKSANAVFNNEDFSFPILTLKHK
jgi:uridine kinase